MRFHKSARIIITLLTVAVFAFSLTSCTQPGKDATTASAAATTGKAAVIELSLAHFFGPTHPAETVLVKGWAEEIEKATNGAVKITSYPGETLAKAADIYNAVVQGVADIGLSCFSYTAGRFPVLESFELPGTVYLNSKSASMVAWDGIKTLNPAEVQDTHLLMVLATGPGDLFTKAPVNNLADLKSMEIRATGISAESLKLLGAVPVGMPQSETYDSLSKGIVKGNLSPVEVLKGWKQAEVTRYITKTPFLYNTLFFVTMNKAKWNSLSADLQKTITDVTEKYQKDVAAGLWDTQDKDALKYAVEEKGMEIIELTEAEMQLWIEKVAPLQETYLAKLKGLGIETNPLTTIKTLADKYNKQYAE